MPDSIFLVGANHELVEATEAPTGLEKELQELLASHIDLLPGAQVDPGRPRRWQLIKREAGIPAEEGGSAWWAVDHLVVDQDAVPTLVEVKRRVDARIRREVVAHMLDYAANATLYWQAETLRAWCDAGDPVAGAARLAAWLGHDDAQPADVAADFWDKVQDNLRDGRVRCIFVADEIPPTLQRLVEFLNERLLRVDVLAVEVRQYLPVSTECAPSYRESLERPQQLRQ